MKIILYTTIFVILGVLAFLLGFIFELATRPMPLISPLAPRPTIDREAVIQDYKDTRFPPWAFETLKVGSNQPSL
jgi:hypothetical protein